VVFVTVGKREIKDKNLRVRHSPLAKVLHAFVCDLVYCDRYVGGIPKMGSYSPNLPCIVYFSFLIENSSEQLVEKDTYEGGSVSIYF
jgi:hypothetical protein